MTWPELPLRRIFRVFNGGTPGPDPDNWNGDIPWATPADLGKFSRYIGETSRTLTIRGVGEGSCLAPSGSILISTRAPIGYVSIAAVEMAFNQGCRALVPRKEVDVRYFAYQLSSHKEKLRAAGQGTTFLELSSQGLAQYRITVPPIGEQRRIADFLEAETVRIDCLVSLRRQQQMALLEKAYSVVSELLIPGITSNPQRCQPWPWLPNLDSAVPWVRLGYVCRIQNGVTVDGKREGGSTSIRRPYLRVANVQAGYLDLRSVTEIEVPRNLAERCTLQIGDVLMTEGGDLDKLGRGAVWRGELPDCLHQNHVFALRPDPGRLDGDYLALLTQSVHGRCYFESTGSRTTNLASTNSSKILGFPIPLRSIEQQRVLAVQAQSALENIAALKERLNQQMQLLAERRSVLITAAVTGQFDVSTASGRGVEA